MKPEASRLAICVAFALFVVSGCATLPPSVTVPQIVEMSQAGESADQMIQKMSDSGTVYRLKASQLADLHKKGVPDAVINYMQETYLDAVRRDQALADWSFWTPDEDGYYYGGCRFGRGPRWCS